MRSLVLASVFVWALAGSAHAASLHFERSDCESVQDYIASNAMTLLSIARSVLPYFVADPTELEPTATGNLSIVDVSGELGVLGLKVGMSNSPIFTVNGLLGLVCTQLTPSP